MKRIRTVLKNILFLFKYSWKISKRIFVASGFSAVLEIVEPFILLILPKFIIDELTGLKRWDMVLHYIILLIAISALIRLLRLGLSVFINMSVNKCDVDTGGNYARHFLFIDYAKLEDGSVRDMQQKVSQNVRPNNIIYEDARELLINLFRLIGYSYIVFTLHPLVLLVIFGVVILNYFLGMRSEKNQYEFQPRAASAARKFDYLFNTMSDFNFAKEVRINQASNWLSSKFFEILPAYIKPYIRFQHRQLGIKILSALTGFVQTAFMYGYAAYQAVSGYITIGDFSVYLGAIFNFSGAFVGFISKITHMIYLSNYVDDYKTYIQLARPSHLDKGVNKLPVQSSHHIIEFRNVSFRYPNTERMILKNVSITISDKEKLSIVGTNGAGKTTFIKLLCRLYEPTSGVILYNGIDISTICYEDYIQLLSVVFQDFQLFAFSMKDNIILNQPDDPEKVIDAVYKSGLDYKLKNLPDGVDTPVSKEFDESGIEFSGGEGQKLVTARAYYKDAPIVILDEPTAALDPISENNLYLRFHQIMKDKTAIFISHRLASTRYCDQIAVFVDGQIAEYGTHDQLMELHGYYSEMFKKQSEYYIQEASL